MRARRTVGRSSKGNDRMLILAIDQSTVRASIALMRDETVVADAEWVQVRRGGASVVSAVPGLLKQAGIAAAEIDLYAVGLGPGTFTSLRVSVSAAAGLALPGEKPVVGIASAEAIAWDVWQQTGRTPQDFIRKKRVENASRLLYHSDQSIKQISAECGFNDRYYFTRVFSREMGISPARYRKNLLLNRI